MSIFLPDRILSLGLSLLLSACSPTHNWRDTAVAGGTLKAQLPCKPDRTSRKVPVGDVVMDMHMVGCESGSALVAVMTASLPVGSDPGVVMAAWQKASLANARVPQPLARGQQQTWWRSGLLPLNNSVRVKAAGQRASGEPVYLDAVWGAVGEGDQMRLIHAVVYDDKAPGELADTLFEGIKP